MVVGYYHVSMPRPDGIPQSTVTTRLAPAGGACPSRQVQAVALFHPVRDIGATLQALGRSQLVTRQAEVMPSTS